MSATDPYVTDEAYTYSPSMRDLGNSSSRADFLTHYGFIIREQLRVTKPGRIACVHVAQVAVKKAQVGFIGLTDFRGDVIRAFQAGGWIFHGEVTVWKDPQAQSIRTKSHALAFQTKNRDSAGTRPALADYLLLFKAPGENKVPIANEARTGEVTNDDWIDWASPIWLDRSEGGDIGGEHLAPVWFGIHETGTLNARNGRERILTPFAGIASELHTAVRLGRRAVGIELKPSYWAAGVENMRALDRKMAMPTLMNQEPE